MRLLRLLTLGLLLIAIAGAITVSYAIRNRNNLVRGVLARIDQRTGFNIIVSGTRLRFRNHLIVVLERPRVVMGGREIAQLAAINAVVSYHTLIRGNGLPLYALGLDHPVLRIPEQAAGVTAGGLPRLDASAVETLKWGLDAVADVAFRLEVNDAALTGPDNRPLVDHLDITAYREHRRPGNWPWLVSFDAGWQHAPIDGLRLAGNIRLGGEVREDRNTIASGRVWFWGLGIDGFDIGGLRASGQMQGSLRMVLSSSGELSGNADVDLRQLAVRGKPLIEPMALGDYSLRTAYHATPDKIDFSGLALEHQGEQTLAGELSVVQPYSSARTAAFSVSGLKIDLTQVGARLRSIAGAPPALIEFTDRIRSGQFSVTQARLVTVEPLQNWTIATVRNNLNLDATLSGVSLVPPPELKLPPVQNFEASISYAKSILELRQGSAKIGKSSLSELNSRANLSGNLRLVPYTLKLRGGLELAEFYPAVEQALRSAGVKLGESFASIRGQAPIDLFAAGEIAGLAWREPREYLARIDLGRTEVSFKEAPGPITFKSGALAIRPGRIAAERVVAALPEGGSIALDGTVDGKPEFPALHNFTVELHQIRVEQWLPRFVNPDQLAAKGAAGGRFVANSDPVRGGAPVVTGKLTLGEGEIQLGFLRAPIVTQSATLTLDGKGLQLALPSSRFEGAPLEFKLTLADFAHPQLRIDARADRLDFEAMRFIRLPWSPATPPTFFPLPVAGHIEARAANFDFLTMANVATDFSHDESEWHVDKFTARSSGGRADLEISGRARDDWIHVKGAIAGMNAASLFALSGNSAPLAGTLYARGDLWANTNVDFFNTLAGYLSVEARNGTLNRFTLLTRILSFIDLKNWITADFPDPRAAGIPFKTLTANFKGRDGDFYTDNLKLQGPVMDITARGNVTFGPSTTMDMQIGLIPFNTVNWIVSKIPLMGGNIASGSSELVAAYFQVKGPVSNPSVTPKPITSVTEFVIKALSLPINIIAPETIKR